MRVGTGAVARSSCDHRDPGDDFFCLRFGVWYASFDCAVRTRHRTCPACSDCDQGRFNLRRHRTAVERARPPLLAID